MTEWLRVNVFTSIRQQCHSNREYETESSVVSGKGFILRVSLQNTSATRKYHQEVQLTILRRRPAPEKETETQRSNIMGGFHGDNMTTTRLVPSRGSSFWAAPASSPCPHTGFDAWPGFWSHYVGWLFWLFLVLLWRYRKEPAEVCLASPCRSSGEPWCERPLMLDHLL